MSPALHAAFPAHEVEAAPQTGYVRISRPRVQGLFRMMIDHKLRYAFRRLMLMGPTEPFERLRAKLRHRAERRLIQRDPDAFSYDRHAAERKEWLDAPDSADLSHLCAEAFAQSAPEGGLHDPELWDRFHDLYPDETAVLIARARSVLDGRVLLFGWKEVEIGEPIRWSSTMEGDNPEDEWPSGHHASCGMYHDPEKPNRDIKWTWELNRFQHALCLGAAWRLTRDEAFAAAARRHIESWMAGNPYPLGVNWASNLEVGIRALAWMRTHLLCVDSPPWDGEFTLQFLAALHMSVAHLERELSTHHTKGNHLLGESAALLHLSLIYPMFREARRRRIEAASILDGLTTQLFHPDGVYAEQSTGYARFALEFIVPIIQLNRIHDIGISPEFLDRAGAALGFFSTIRPDGRDMPAIGDEDSGAAIGFRLSDSRDVAPLMAAGAVILGRSELVGGLERLPAETALMVGREAIDRFGRLKSEAGGAAPVGDRAETTEFGRGGYLVCRCRIFTVVFDVGPLGLAPDFAHGHADALSFVLSVNGRWVCVDPGTGFYNGPPRIRDYFRSVRSHNSVRIDGRNQSEPIGPFRWSRPVKTSDSGFKTGKGWSMLFGEYKGGEIRHRRSLIHLPEQAVIIVDETLGVGPHLIERFLHFAPDCSVELNEKGNILTTVDSGRLLIGSTGPPHPPPVLHRGEEHPPFGLYSPAYGRIVPTVTAHWSLDADLPVQTAFIMAPANLPVLVPQVLLNRFDVLSAIAD